MDKQKEIEKMAFSVCKVQNEYESITSCEKCGYTGICRNQEYAEEFIKKGYGDVRYVVKEVLNKVFRYVEEARLECEFQDKDGKWFMDESEFMCEFTLGKLQELYR